MMRLQNKSLVCDLTHQILLRRADYDNNSRINNVSNATTMFVAHS